ncbi:MAG: IPT/TIG domain-containing protein [Capsulimonas sp.]|uniref:IPT/TIG domain-containing protein n=1 Tax=Capsulimonas sp. TaxID=2494211 RepID=UPI003265A215
MKCRIAAFAVTFGMLATAQAQAQAQAHERVLVDVPLSISFPTKINNVGDILGYGSEINGLYPVLLHNSVVVRLPALNPIIVIGMRNSYILNNNSQIMYFGYTSGSSGDISTRVLDTKTGITVDIGKIPGYPSTIGTSLNDSGDIVGYAYSPTGRLPFLWRNGQFSQLPLPVGAPVGAAYSYRSLNNRGDVLGDMSNGIDGVSVLIWRDGVPTFLPMPTPANRDISLNQFFAFNDKDQVLTTYHDYHYVTSNYHILTLTTPPIIDNYIGTVTSEPISFNNLGDVLERYAYILNGSPGNGWAYRLTNIPLDGIVSGGHTYQFVDAYCINDNVDVLGKVYQVNSGIIYKTVVYKAIPAPVPQITGLTPDRAIPGMPSIPVTINGAGFDPDSTVLLNGSVQASSHYLSATQMQVVIPASLMAQPRTMAIKVVTPAPGGGASNTQYFNVTVPRATILNINPNRLFPGAGAAQITINGLDFDPGAVVTVNDTYTITPTFVSPYQLTAIVPSSVTDTAGSYFVRVVNPGWSNASTPAPLTVALPAPIISLISPDRVGVGLTSLKLNLYGPYNYQPTVKVSFNGGAPVTPEAITGSRVTVPVPSSLLSNPGNIMVRLVDSFEHGGSSAPATLAVATRPTLTGLTPNHTAVGAGAVTVTLSGSNFEASSTITINNGAPLAMAFVSPTQLRVLVPSSVTAVKGNYVVRVVNTGYSNFSNPQAFTVTP